MKPALICLALACLLAACEDQQHVEAPTPRPVLTVVVAPHMAPASGFAGTIEPRYKSDLGFRVLGRIVSRDVAVGEIVNKDQRLAALDPVALEFAVRNAQADLESAQAQLDNAVLTEARKLTLLRKEVASHSDFEAAEQARESAAARVTRAKANLDTAKEQLTYAELRAPFDGVVTAVHAETGQVVQPGQTVVTVARTDIREAVVDVPEAIWAEIGQKARFEMALQLDPKTKATGWVREIAPHSDQSTRTRRVRITLDNPSPGFRLGTIITATLVKAASSVVSLPNSALLEQDGLTKVWVLDPATNTVSAREVKVAAGDESGIQVVEGLDPGTRVVAAGVHSLSQGQAVLIEGGTVQ